jgi:hypothetical protein
LQSIWAEEEYWDDFLSDPKNRTDYGWFRNYTYYWVPDIEELLGPRLATGNHAHTAKSARIAAEEAVKTLPGRRLLESLEDEDTGTTIADFEDIEGNI